MSEAPEPGRLRVALVDDEPLARDGLRLFLADEDDVEIVGEAATGSDAVALIAATRPDLVFLDVQMPGMNGFEVIAALPAEQLPEVVFVTAFDQHALRAFEVAAIDYLLKPVDERRFREALRRAREARRLARVSTLSQQLLELVGGDAGGDGPAPLSRLVIRSAGRVVFLSVADIDWIEAADYYAQIHVGGHSHLHRQSLASLAEQLDPEQFVRIHRSAIVNVARVRELRRHGRRELVAILDGGVELKVGRSQRDKLARLLGRD
jgi:two-component system LytT family response regulator